MLIKEKEKQELDRAGSITLELTNTNRNEASKLKPTLHHVYFGREREPTIYACSNLFSGVYILENCAL